MCCVFSFSTPPCIYSREPRVRSCQSSAIRRCKPMRCRHIAEVGPTGRSADQAGRPACQWRQPPPTSSGGLFWAALSGPCWSWPVLSGFGVVLRLHLVQLSLNRRSDIFCDFMSGQSVLASCILAQKHNLHFLEGEVWFWDFWIKMRVRNANSHDFLIKLTPGNGR